MIEAGGGARLAAEAPAALGGSNGRCAYQPTSWGFDDGHPIDAEDLEVGEKECP